MISVLIPAYNEEDRIAETIRAVRTLSAVDEIVVVDDGSTDATADRAENAGADIVYRQPNRGKGAALTTALTLSKGTIVLLLDADLGASATEGEKLLAPLIEGAADMTIATFPVQPGKGGGMGFVVRLARNGIRRLTHRTMTAPLSGQRAIRRNVLTTIGGFAAGWGVEVALTVTALRAGFRVLEVPTNMSHRVTGRDMAGFSHRFRQYLAIRAVLAQLAAAPQPTMPDRES